MSLTLEMGMYYRTRKGEQVQIVGEYDESDELFRIFGYTFIGRRFRVGGLINYLPNGRAINDDRDDPHDLMHRIEKHDPIAIILQPAHIKKRRLGYKERFFLEAILELKDEALEFRLRDRLSQKLNKRLPPKEFKEISLRILFKSLAVAQDAEGVVSGLRADRRLFMVTPTGKQKLKEKSA